jgi:hypothetical protein
MRIGQIVKIDKLFPLELLGKPTAHGVKLALFPSALKYLKLSGGLCKFGGAHLGICHFLFCSGSDHPFRSCNIFTTESDCSKGI